MAFLDLAGLFLLLLPGVAQASGTRSDQWRENAHIVGETFPRQDSVRKLLGRPDSIEVIVVKGQQYAKRQSLSCAPVDPGTRLAVWRYAASPSFTYLVYFRGSEMVCLGSES
jgi:hypothetical protein